MALSELLGILVCPACREPLRPHRGDTQLVCGSCRLGYPVLEGIPVMLAEEAERIEDHV